MLEQLFLDPRVYYKLGTTSGFEYIYIYAVGIQLLLISTLILGILMIIHRKNKRTINKIILSYFLATIFIHIFSTYILFIGHGLHKHSFNIVQIFNFFVFNTKFFFLYYIPFVCVLVLNFLCEVFYKVFVLHIKPRLKKNNNKISIEEIKDDNN